MITEELLKLCIQHLVWKYVINIPTHYARNVLKINNISNKDTLRISEITAYEKRSYALCVCDVFFLKLKENSNVTANKGKANPLQAWTGPEGSSRLRLSDFNITARSLKFIEGENFVYKFCLILL
jgi:hypothetical protein